MCVCILVCVSMCQCRSVNVCVRPGASMRLLVYACVLVCVRLCVHACAYDAMQYGHRYTAMTCVRCELFKRVAHCLVRPLGQKRISADGGLERYLESAFY